MDSVVEVLAEYILACAFSPNMQQTKKTRISYAELRKLSDALQSFRFDEKEDTQSINFSFDLSIFAVSSAALAWREYFEVSDDAISLRDCAKARSFISSLLNYTSPKLREFVCTHI